MDWRKLCKHENWHKVADLLPLMDEAALAALAEDIKEHGVQQPIVLFQGKVLDGRNRLRACESLGVPLTSENFVAFQPNGFSPRQFVFTQNLHRRQLTIDQRAAIAAELKPSFEAEMAERKRKAGKYGVQGGRGHKKPSGREKPEGLTAAKLAAKLVGGVSDSYVKLVLSLEKKKRGTLNRIKNGEITIREAKKEVDALFTHELPLFDRYGGNLISVFDARSGKWGKKKDCWRALGVKETHIAQENTTQQSCNGFADHSVFDPVLAECVCVWFARKGWHVLDPFAGEATKGIVAGCAGLRYTGYDQSKEQVAFNRQQAIEVAKKYRQVTGKKFVMPEWIEADSENLGELSGAKYDMVFTSPPYWTKELYPGAKSGTRFRKYEDFMVWYQRCFAHAVARLKPNRFLVVKVQNLRDPKTGFFINWVGDNIRMFERFGLHFYCDGILATSVGNSAQHAATRFPTARQLESAHQNVLCFWNGDDASLVGKELGTLEPLKG
jgi:16S rRNA G966 N2-methylase RsmD